MLCALLSQHSPISAWTQCFELTAPNIGAARKSKTSLKCKRLRTAIRLWSAPEASDVDDLNQNPLKVNQTGTTKSRDLFLLEATGAWRGAYHVVWPNIKIQSAIWLVTSSTRWGFEWGHLLNDDFSFVIDGITRGKSVCVSNKSVLVASSQKCFRRVIAKLFRVLVLHELLYHKLTSQCREKMKAYQLWSIIFHTWLSESSAENNWNSILQEKAWTGDTSVKLKDSWCPRFIFSDKYHGLFWKDLQWQFSNVPLFIYFPAHLLKVAIVACQIIRLF